MKTLLLALVLMFSSCSVLTPEHIKALAENDASICLQSSVQGGAGGIIGGATGGYGQGSFTVCRSNRPNAKLSVKPDGEMSIENGPSAVENDLKEALVELEHP